MGARYLVVVADDYGIGPDVSRGIRELMHMGSVTATVLMVNSPHAEHDVRLWHKQATPGDLGWHPCLTMDAPVAPVEQVSSIVNKDGKLLALGKWLTGTVTGRISYDHVLAELDAQYRRCCDLVGHPPQIINGHKHIHIFPLVRKALAEVLHNHKVTPYLRQVRESWGCLRRIPGARIKRLFLSTLGVRAARRHSQAGFPGNDYLAGITDPKWVEDPDFYAHWLKHVPGDVVELAVHPGYYDETLLGRDCIPSDGQLQRRVTELKLLKESRFLGVCRALGFTLISASKLLHPESRGLRNAA
jgi:predicted glycoside hydrolase/deacetylase ChbG (UPF0249 family)